MPPARLETPAGAVAGPSVERNGISRRKRAETTATTAAATPSQMLFAIAIVNARWKPSMKIGWN